MARYKAALDERDAHDPKLTVVHVVEFEGEGGDLFQQAYDAAKAQGVLKYAKEPFPMHGKISLNTIEAI